jgi:hypothetical protein
MNNIFKVFIISFILLAFLFFACSKNGTEPEPVKYKWTILGYFDGNNPEDQSPDGHSYVIKDVQELEKINSTQDVQIVVMLGSVKNDGSCRYYHIQRHLDEPQDEISSEVLSLLGKKDMSLFTTLRDFISYGRDKYPADHYLLIINDHAAGWKGLCSDAVNGGGSWMSLPEFSSALSGYNFDIIWFYTPSLATAEVAYQIKDQAKYMVASQYKWYPDNIMGADVWLSYLTENPNTDVREFARRIPQAVDSAAYLVSPIKHFHSAAINLSKLSTLASDVSNLAQSLIDYTGSNWSKVWSAWEISHNYDDCDSLPLDLREFVRRIQNQTALDTTIRNRALLVENSVNSAVITQYLYPEYGVLGGISIHSPWDESGFDFTDYSELHFAETGWVDFISAFIKTYSGFYAGRLDIRSNPTGARVFLDDVDTGDSTNMVIGVVLPGSHVIKLTKTGYQDWISPTYTLLPQETRLVYAILKPGP